MKKTILFIVLLYLAQTLIPIVKAKDKLYYIDIPITEDTYIEKGFPTTSPWNNRNLFLGRDTWYDKNESRILIKTNLARIDTEKIRAEDIDSAMLKLTLYQSETNAHNIPVYAARLLEPWSIYTVNWNNSPNKSQESVRTTISSTLGTKFIDVKEIIKYFMDNPSNNNGIELSIHNKNLLATIFWGNGCSVAPTLPRCNSESEAPILRIIYKRNDVPSLCGLSSVDSDISNTKKVKLKALTSTDKENDSITYTGRVCADANCNSVVWEGGISTNSITDVPVINDQTYFLQCTANDFHNSNIWGNTLEFIVDTVPPNIPTLIDEPEFTSSRLNTIFWLGNDQKDTEYQIISSERSTFSAYNQYSNWSKEQTATIDHSKEKKYYYKVRAKDKADNISNWSESTYTTIDTSYPTIRYFKNTKSIVSPRSMKDGKVVGAAYIQGGVTDKNLREITLQVFSEEQKIIYSENSLSKSYIRTHWPDKLGYKDGRYFMLLKGIDNTGKSIESDPIFIEIDKTPPPKAVIAGTSRNKVHSKLPIKIKSTCTSSINSRIYIGNKLYGKDKVSYLLTISPKDGSHSLNVKCYDRAGNTSENKIIFRVDTTPPTRPSLNLFHDTKTDNIIGKIYCRENGKAAFYIRGILQKSIKCKSKKYVSVVLKHAPSKPSYFHAEVRVADQYGNWSDLSSKVLYIRALSQNIPRKNKTECIAKYNISKQELSVFSCTWKSNIYASYVSTKEQKNRTFQSTFEVYNPGETSVNLVLFRCKKKSFFDIRTWFSCYEQKIGHIVTVGKTIPILSSKDGLSNISQHQILAKHKSNKEVEITQKLMTYFYYQTYGAHIHGIATSQKLNKHFTIRLPKNVEKRIFSWIFRKIESVSQWHGYTAFQKPHKGIDFSVFQKTVLVPADGVVVSTGAFKRNTCFSGGNYIAIKHNNGMHTYYFHLKSLNTPDGKRIRNGWKVKKGQALLVTGNSGVFNCQKLGYHLHFEVRTSRSPSTHLNPVPYFDINWNKIMTARAKRYPGRLTGDNPHPKF